MQRKPTWLAVVSICSAWRAAGRLARLDLPWKRKLPAVEFGIACKRERTLPPTARTFIDLIRKRIRAVERL